MNNKPVITSEMTLTQILELFPDHREELYDALGNAGFCCGCCSQSSSETLKQGMTHHGMTAEEMEEILTQLNEIVSASPASTITLTESAAQKFKEFAVEEGKGGAALRFGLIPTSCHSFEYLLAFSEKPEEDDQIFESSGIQIHINREMVKALLGTRIDYIEEGAQGGGFAIANPNKRGGGGCGGCGGGGGCCGR